MNEMKGKICHCLRLYEAAKTTTIYEAKYLKQIFFFFSLFESITILAYYVIKLFSLSTSCVQETLHPITVTEDSHL